MGAHGKRIASEPCLSIVRRMIELGALREGGHGSLTLAADLADVARASEGHYPTDAVADYLRTKTRIAHIVNDPDDVVIVAGLVVDIVRAHDQSGEG